MPNMKQIGFVFVLVLALLSTATAQDGASTVSQKSSLTITANVTGDRVRVTAPSSVVQLHLEVYASSGEKLFDQEIRGGNVFDWHLQDGQAQRLAPGAYVCVVTAKSVSGRITQKLGTVTVAEKSASVQAGSLQLSLQQSQAIGPVEADSSWTIAGENEPQTPTVIANDGTDGQMIRGRGALTFRVGNFFSGIDTEQMRLTEAGDLGIGTSTPQAKLEVAGAIRAERFLIVKPGKSGGDKTMVANATTDARDSVQPLVGGGGTTGRLTKWTDGSSGTLGDSVITETVAGNIGIGTTSPQGALHLRAGLNKNIWFRDAGPTQRAQIISVADDNGTINTLSLDAAPLILNSQSSSNVGVGTTAPQARLDIEAIDGVGSQATEVLRIGKGTMDAGGDEAYINFVNASNTLGRVGVVAEGSSTGDLYLSVANAGAVSKALTAKFNGNVGIGTTNPVSKLDVAGDINTSTKYNIAGNGVLSVTGSSPDLSTTNTFVGVGAGLLNTPAPTSGVINPGNFNSFFGNDAGRNNQLGTRNSYFGYSAGRFPDASENSFFGVAAGYNSGGSQNSFFGVSAGEGMIGESNTAVGKNAGVIAFSGSRVTLVGAETNMTTGNLENATAIGYHAQVSQSNSLILGNNVSVGIGTTSPVARLNVVGSGGSGQGIQFDNREIKFRGDGDAHYSIFANRIPGTLTIEDTSSNFNVNTAGTVLLAIAKTSGNVGLGGVTAPTSKLQVNGQGRFSTVNIDSYVAGQSGLTLCTASSGVNQNLIGLCSSSLRYKKNVQTFRAGLSIINRLRPISFDWKDGGLHDVGLAAEEVDKVEPLLTFRNDKGEIQGVKYTQLSAVFINAFKEQQQQITQQQAAAKHQQEEIDALRKANAALNARLQLIELTLKNKRSSTRQRR